MFSSRSQVPIGAFAAKLARWGWYVLIGTPLLLAILPWSRMLDFGHLDDQKRDAMKSMLGIALGLGMFMMLAPKLLSISRASSARR